MSIIPRRTFRGERGSRWLVFNEIRGIRRLNFIVYLKNDIMSLKFHIPFLFV